MLHIPIAEIIKKISDEAKLPEAKVKELIKRKTESHEGLVSEEGAAYIVAHDLNVELFKVPTESDARIDITDLVVGMRTFEVVGKVTSVLPIREFKKQGKMSQVGNFNLADESGVTRIVLWDQKANIIKEGKLKQGQIVKVKNGNIKTSNYSPSGKEVHLTIRSQLILDVDEKINVKIPEAEGQQQVISTTLDKIQANQRIKTRGTIVRVFPPAFYDCCPQCRRKVFDGKCNEHGDVESEPATVLSIVVDDGTSAIRCTAFRQEAEKLSGMSGKEAKEKSENPVLIQEELDKTLLGEIIELEGYVRENKQFDRTEITINSTNAANPIEIAKELMK